MSNETFQQVVMEVMERFAFMFGEESDAPAPDANGDYLHASISFQSETAKGELRLTVPLSLGTDIAANVLGVDPSEATPAIGEDAVKELLNIICGDLTARMFGKAEVFRLTVPTLTRLDTKQWKACSEAEGTFRLLVEGRPVLASLAVK
jgi:chemotaxis protein CheY-P-specific phosphatase CheC